MIETKRPLSSSFPSYHPSPLNRKIHISIMKNYRSIGNDEESPSMDEQQEQQQARLEAFALKRKATIGVCVYAAAIASTMMFAYSRHGSSSSEKTIDHSKVLDLHAVKTSMQSTDFTHLNQQVEAMLDQKQSQNNRKLVGGPAGAQAQANAAVSGVSSSSSSSGPKSASSSGSKSSSSLSSPTLSTPPQGTSGTLFHHISPFLICIILSTL